MARVGVGIGVDCRRMKSCHIPQCALGINTFKTQEGCVLFSFGAEVYRKCETVSHIQAYGGYFHMELSVKC